MALLVQSLTEFINSSFSSANDLNHMFASDSETTTLDDFKELFVVSKPDGALLTNYYDFDDNEILPDQRIAGEYTCISGNESQTISINVTSE